MTEQIEEKFSKLIMKEEDLKHSSNMLKYELYFEQLYLEDNTSLATEESIVKFEEIYRRDQRTVLKLKTLFSLQFVQENRVGSTYVKCLRNFLQTDSLVDIVEEEEDEDISLIYRSKKELFQLLRLHCRIETEAALQKLKQRAAFKLSPGEVEYKVLVYLKESPDLKYPVKEVRALLRDYKTKMGKKMKIEVFHTEILDVLKLLSNQQLYEKSFLVVSQDNIISTCSYNGLDYLDGDHCVKEKMFLRLMGGGLDVASAMAQVLERSRVKNILQDWNQELVFTFDTSKDYNKFIEEIALVEKNPNSPEDIALVAHKHLYNLTTPFKIDIRDFLPIDPDCRLSQDSREICSKNKTFPFLCFSDDQIMRKYSLKLSEKCIERK